MSLAISPSRPEVKDAEVATDPLLAAVVMTAGLFPTHPPIPEMIGVLMTKMILLPWLPLLWQPEVSLYVFFDE